MDIDRVLPPEEIIRRYKLMLADVESVNLKDRIGIKTMLEKFSTAGIDIGIGYKRAYGTVLSGDSFQLFTLQPDIYLFIFSDVSGHGMEAYTTYIKLRSAALLAVRLENQRMTNTNSTNVDFQSVVDSIVQIFTDIMEESISRDFACVIFAFLKKDADGSFSFTFYNRGMHYPVLVLENEDGSVMDINLNDSCFGWNPRKNPPLGSDFRVLLGDKYIKSDGSSIQLKSGARICFFTDGIPEAASNSADAEEFGVERLISNLVSTYSYFPQASVNFIYNQVFEFIGNQKRQYDDMTMVVIDIPVVES